MNDVFLLQKSTDALRVQRLTQSHQSMMRFYEMYGQATSKLIRKSVPLLFRSTSYLINHLEI